MSWFERNRLMLCRLCLAVWVVAFAFAALQGCLSEASPAVSSVWSVTTVSHHGDGHHHEACAQLCDATNTAVPQTHAYPPAADQLTLALFLILPLFLLPLVGDADRTWRALLWPPLPKQPARLRFVRFND